MPIKTKNLGFTLVEMTLTMLITSIVFVIFGVFMIKPVLLFTQIARQSTATSQLNVGLGVLAKDFANYAGGISVVNNIALNTLSLQFNLPNSEIVIYNCNFNTKTAYRQSSITGSQVLLNNISNCNFRKNISLDGITLFLSVKIAVTVNNTSVALTEILNVPNI